ncbi:hypothetical protein Tco_1545967 [Tanacetum coccineum]
MSNMSEDIWYAGSDTRPPMLDRTDFESWQQRIRLYCLGKDNGENIMKSITEGPFQMGTFIQTPAEDAEETEGALQLGPERARVFTDLSAEEKERYKADIRATNILLQGIPKDIYTLINHYTDAKDIWDNVKMILEGSELTKDDRESQLYDEFERFCQIKGETIHVYYVRFSKLINDMRNIKMTMSRMQLNSKLTNTLVLLRTSSNARNKATDQDYRKRAHIARECSHNQSVLRFQTTSKDKMPADECSIENGAVLDESSSDHVMHSSSESLMRLPTTTTIVHGVNTSTEASGSKPRGNTKKNRIPPAKTENKKKVEVHPRTNNSVNATPTVKIVLNKGKQIWKPKGKLSDNSLNKTKQIWKPKGKLSDNSLNKTKQIWKPKGKLSDNSLNKTKQVWKATGKLFANVGYQWRSTGKKVALGKLNCGYQWRPTGMNLFWNTLTPDAKTGVYSFQVDEHWLTLSVDLLRKALNVTPADSAHPFESPPAGKTDITFTREKSSFKLVDEDEVQPAPEPHMDDYEVAIREPAPQTTRKLPVVEDATSTKMVRETLSHADAESGGNLEKINSETYTEILNVGDEQVFPQGVTVGPTIEDTSITQADLHPSVNPVAGEPSSAQSITVGMHQGRGMTHHQSSFWPKNFFKGAVDPTLFTRKSDADHAGCQDSRRSTSGSAQSLGDSWLAGHQRSKATSTAYSQQRRNTCNIPLYCDNKSAIALSCNNVQHYTSAHRHTTPISFETVKWKMEWLNITSWKQPINSLSIETVSDLMGIVLFIFIMSGLWPIGRCNRVTERQTTAKVPNLQSSSAASADLHSSVTETTETKSTLSYHMTSTDKPTVQSRYLVER